MKNNNEQMMDSRSRERRKFLGAAAAAGAALTLPGVVRGQSATPVTSPQNPIGGSTTVPNHTLVYVFLRGGPDGLALLAPWGDVDYAGYRPNLGIQGGIPLASTNFTASNYWLLSSALRPLLYPYSKSDFALLPAVGRKNGENNKSHFVAMDLLEFGTPLSTQPNPGPITTGFAARHINKTNFVTTAPLRGLMLQKNATTSFLGAKKSLAIANPSNFKFAGDDDMRPALTQMNQDEVPVMKRANRNTFAAIDYLDFTWSSTPDGYPIDPNTNEITALGRKFREAEQLIKLGVAPEIIQIDYGGWDTHDSQGPNAGGDMYLRTAELAEAMANFYRRLENFVVPGTGQVAIDRCSVVTIGEFGRRIEENTSAGTDHGNGGLVMAMGGRVNGGRIYDDLYYNNWDPAVGPSALTAADDGAGDLTSFTDHRDIFAEAFTKLMGLSDATKVFFPGYSLPTGAPALFS